MVGKCVESMVRYIPVTEAKEWLSKFTIELKECNKDELMDAVVELLEDADYKYNCSFMSDFDYTYKEVDGKGVVEDTQEEWNEDHLHTSSEYVKYYEVYDYSCSFYEYDDDCDVFDVKDLYKGAVSDCGWVLPENFINEL